MQDPNYPELIASDAGNFRPMGIRNLSPGLVERGKIKIGQKGQMRTSGRGNQFQPPQKLDHFLITSMERGEDGNFMRDTDVMQMLGDKPREIPVRLVYDDIDLNFPSRYAAYIGKTLWCTGDGQQARRANVDEKGNLVAGHHLVQCPCPRQDPAYQGRDKCKITGTLSVIIDGADVVGGVWKYRTTSYNSVVGILSSLAMIKRITGGRLAGIPLVMKLSPKAVTDPVKGSQQTVYVVSLEYRGSVQQLRDAGYAALKEDKEHGARIEHIEDQAKALLADRSDEYETESDDIVDEFYIDQAKEAAGVTPQHQGTSREEQSPRQRTKSFQNTAKAEPKQEAKRQPEPEPEPEQHDNEQHDNEPLEGEYSSADDAPAPEQDDASEQDGASSQGNASEQGNNDNQDDPFNLF